MELWYVHYSPKFIKAILVDGISCTIVFLNSDPSFWPIWLNKGNQKKKIIESQERNYNVNH